MKNFNYYSSGFFSIILLMTALLPATRVWAGNTAPTISGTPAARVNVGSLYSFQPKASDADGDTIYFSSMNRPAAWLSFDKATGRIWGRPTAADVGVYENIIIKVKDGLATRQLPPFTITVSSLDNVNPTISGLPGSTAVVGSTYAFKPVAADADGDELVYFVLNKPAWTSFNSTTGKLSGVPGAGDVGDYKNIQIYVSDRKSYVPLPAFAIKVTSATGGGSTGSAPISWNPPVKRADGTALAMSEISGFRIYYGTKTGQYPDSRMINGGYRTSAVVSGLPVNTYYMVVTTIDTDGRESGYSKEVVKVVKAF